MNNLLSYGSIQGDTLIVFSSKYLVLAHSNIILENCKKLAPFLTEARGAKLKGKSKRPGALRWRVDLTNFEDKYVFVPKVSFITSNMNLTVDKFQLVTEHGLTESIVSSNDDTINEALLIALRDAFGLLYHVLPNYGTTIKEILTKGLMLINAGQILDTLFIVGESIERALLNCSDSMWSYVARKPAEFLVLARTIRSRSIFKEALIHCVGKWKLMNPNQRARVGEIEELRNLVLVKLVSTWQFKKKKERDMVGYYPDNLKDIRNDQRTMAGSAPGRVVYAAHIFSWIALCLFRQWMGQMISEGASFRAGDGGYILYTAMSKGGNHYLKRAEMDSFYQIFPMTDKARNIIDNAMNLIKDGMKPFVDTLIVKRAQFNHVQYLTNCEVDEKDYPWLHPLDEKTILMAHSFMKQFPEFGIWAPPIGNGRLSKLSASVLLEDHTEMIASPNEYVTNTCVAMQSSRSSKPNTSITSQANSQFGVCSKTSEITRETKQSDKSDSLEGGRNVGSLPKANFSTVSHGLGHMLSAAGFCLEGHGAIPSQDGTCVLAPYGNSHAASANREHAPGNTGNS